MTTLQFRKRRRSAIAVIILALWIASTFFPLWASLVPGDPARIIGIVDVALAGILVLLLMAAHSAAGTRVSVQHQARSYAFCRILAAVPLLLMLMFIAGLQLKWDVLLIGLAWRIWYLVTALPYILALRRNEEAAA